MHREYFFNTVHHQGNIRLIFGSHIASLRRCLVVIFTLLLFAVLASGQKVESGPTWLEVSGQFKDAITQTDAVPIQFRAFRLNKAEVSIFLRQSNTENFTNIDVRSILKLPHPSGGFQRFVIEESSIMSEELANNFPDIKSYRGQGIDDPSATVRISFSFKGFNAFIVSPGGSFMITPHLENGEEIYLSYFIRDSKSGKFDCFTREPFQLSVDNFGFGSQQNLTGQTLRSYRIVISATTQFYQFSGNTDDGLVATINTLLNSVNAIYEREATIRFVFHAWLADRQGTYFPLNQNLGQMKELNQPLTDNFVGNLNYDSAHVFGYINNPVPGGSSNFSALCNNPIKAKVASIVNLNLVQSTLLIAHELGHKFNARHSFSSFSGPCAGQNDPAGRFEPGSGSTIMSYAGICSPENLQTISDNVFHVNSILGIINHVDTVYPACGLRTATGNAPPVISGATGVGAFIPTNTPFSLTGFASDPNGDPLTYSWEQIDSGTGLSIFRPYLPATVSSRTFPSIPFILNNANVPPTFINGFLVGELLPNSTRTLNFALTVRDNRVAGGGTAAGTLQINVRGEAGPFVVTQPNSNITWVGNSQQTVTWNVANTNTGLVNTANVRITLSTDGGQTFPTTLAESTPNDGSQTVTVPNVLTSTARIRVEAVGNIYFDISNVNFSIVQACLSTSISVGQTINETLNTDCSFVGTNRYLDIYTFSGTAGQRVAISMNSTAFNSYLSLVNSNNVVIQEDDNGGGGTNSRIPVNSGFFELPATGVYSIYATSVFANSVGAYSVSLLNAPTCNYSLSSASQNIPATAGIGSVNVIAASGCAWTAASNAAWVTVTSGASGNGNGTVNFSVAANTGAGRTGTITAAGQTFTINQAAALLPDEAPFDFDGDGKTDIAIFRPAQTGGEWWWQRSSDGQVPALPFGLATDVIAPGDFTGDGKLDITIWRPETGFWFILRSEDNSFYGFPFGATGDVPMTADYDGDGKDDPTVFRSQVGLWFIFRSTDNQVETIQFGLPGDVPIAADYDGDGRADVAIRRNGPNGAEWWINRSTEGVIALIFGATTDRAVPGDYTGDGRADIAYFRPATGSWFILRSEDFSFFGFPFGANGDVPSPGDYDGDGRIDPTVFRPSTNTWFISGSTSGTQIQNFGLPGDRPIPNAFVR